MLRKIDGVVMCESARLTQEQLSNLLNHNLQACDEHELLRGVICAPFTNRMEIVQAVSGASFTRLAHCAYCIAGVVRAGMEQRAREDCPLEDYGFDNAG